MVSIWDLLFAQTDVAEWFTGVDIVPDEIRDDPAAIINSVPMTDVHEKRILAGAAAIGALAVAPSLYALGTKKSRSKRKQAKQAQEAAALEKLSGNVRDGLKTAFLAPMVALPAALITLEMLGRYPKARTVYHPEIGHWETITQR